MPARDHLPELLETGLEVGEVVADRFRILGLLGRGGMGEVYEAEHRILRKSVALKLLRRRRGDDRRSDGGAGAIERLLREARAASQLSSPHAIRILDAGVADETAFIAMELLEGADLGAMIAARGRLAPEEAVAVVLEACDALGEAHDAGIVHRDVKPSNLFLARNPRGGALVKVLDFGVAKLLLEEADGSATITGSVIGSPRYMSPEQVRDPRKIDARTDVWSLGITLHELLTGRAPFRAEFPSALCAMVTTDPPDLSIDDGDMPGLSALVRRCLEKDRAARFADAKELGRALREIAGSRAQLPSVWTHRERSDASTATPAPAETQASAVLGRARRSSSAPRSRTAWVPAGIATAAVIGLVAAGLHAPSETPARVAEAAAAPSAPTATAVGAPEASVSPSRAAPSVHAQPVALGHTSPLGAMPTVAVPSRRSPAGTARSVASPAPTRTVDEGEVLKNRD